jgi:hypothetical protein
VLQIVLPRYIGPAVFEALEATQRRGRRRGVLAWPVVLVLCTCPAKRPKNVA